MRTLVLDCNFLGWQAFYSMKNLSFDSAATGVIFGFFNQLLSLQERFQSNKFVFAWDSKKSLRRRICPSYKQKRRDNQSEEELKMKLVAFKQFSLLKEEILPYIGFKNIFCANGYEGDDIIASIVHNKQNACVIVASDEDLYQLLDYALIYNPKKKETFSKDDFVVEYEIKPVQWIDVKTLAGCDSDGVKGIPDIGEKTAIKYLKGILPFKSKAYQAITNPENKSLIELNNKLITLPYKDCPTFEIIKDEFSIEKFEKVCYKYGMQSFIGDLKKWSVFE